MLSRRVACLATLFASLSCLAQDAPEVRAGSIIVSGAWTRPTAAGMPMGVAYFVVRNTGASTDVLVSASSPAAARVEFHQTTFSGGMARMRPLREIAVPAASTVAVAPGGVHLMLVDLRAPLVAGTQVPLILEFRTAGKVGISLVVADRTD